MKISIKNWKPLKENDNKLQHVLLKMDSAGLGSGHSRPPIHLALILDKSGSMEGDKMELLKEAASHFINWLTRRDFITIITYDSESQVIYPHSQLTDKISVMNEIYRIETGGTTNLSGGWLLGLSELYNNFSDNDFHHVILLTDGRANEGITDSDRLLRIGTNYLNRGIRTTTLGFGIDFDEDLLKHIADGSSGRFYFVENPEDIGRAFHAEYGELSDIAGQNLTVKFAGSPDVTVSDIYSDFPGEITENEFNLRLGDILSDDIKQLLFTVRIPSDFPEGKSLGEISVNYNTVVGDMEPFHIKMDIVNYVIENNNNIKEHEEVKKELWLIMSSRVKLLAADLSQNKELTMAKQVILDHLKWLDELGVESGEIELEKKRLLELSERINRKEIQGIRKSVVQNAYSMRQKRGEYLREPGVDILEELLNPEMPEKRAEFEARLKAVLRDKEYGNDSINDIHTVLNELLNNSLLHGCKDKPGSMVKVSCRIAPVHIRIMIKDPGEGFDYSAVISDNNNASGNDEHGHGLRLVKKLSLRLSYSDDGTKVEAVVMKNRLQAESFIAREADGCLFLNDVVVVKLSGEINMGNMQIIKDKLQMLLEHSYVKLVIDMTGLDFIDSSGIGMFISFLKKVSMYQDGAMVLACLSSRVNKIVQLTNLDSLFEIFKSVDDAIQYLRE